MKSKAATLRRAVLTGAIVMGLCTSAGMVTAQTLTRPWNDTTLSPDARAKLLLAQLTQDEKFQLLHSYYAGPDRPADKPFPKGAIASAGYIAPIDRLGIPALEESDAGLGVASSSRMRPGDHATPLPAGPVTAASWGSEGCLSRWRHDR